MSGPTPRIVLGDNNVYPLRLAEGGVLLIDSGLDYRSRTNATSWDSVVAQADALAFAPTDVRVVVVTHAHIDHAGLVPRWLDLGARVLVGEPDRPAVAVGREANEAHRPLRIAELRRHGCPEQILDGLAAVRGRRGLDWLPCDLDALEPAEGARFALASGGAIEVLPAPGHTPGNLVAWNGDSRELYTGDTILPTTIPTPGLHFTATGNGDHVERWPSLPPFLESVAKLERFPVARILPGHGDPVEDPGSLFERFAAHHDRRARRIVAALDGGATTAFEVARTLFRRIPDDRIGQAMTEVIGHLDVLEAANRVIVVEDEVRRYQLVEAGRA